jgi:hypothetical protein
MWTGAARAARLLLPNFLKEHTQFKNVREVDSVSDIGGGYCRYLVTTWFQRNDAAAPKTAGGGEVADDDALSRIEDSIRVLAAAVHTRGSCWLVDLPSVVFRGGVGVGAWVSISDPPISLSLSLSLSL